MSICLCKNCKGLWIDFQIKQRSEKKEICPNCESKSLDVKKIGEIIENLVKS